MTANPETDRVTAIYDAIDAFQRQFRTVGLQHAQIRASLAEYLARALPAVVSSPPATDRATLRDRVAEALLGHLSRTADVRPARSGDLAFMPEVTDEERLRIADAVLAVLPDDARAALARVERLALTFEVSGNEFIAEQIRAAIGARQSEPENACAHCGSSEHSWDECEAYTALTAEQPDTETQDGDDALRAAGLPLVQGTCPACHSASLFLGNGGYVTCSRIDCPEPDAATTVLAREADAAGGAGGVADETGEGDRIVAYRAPVSNNLYCAPCGESDRSTPLTSDDLPDGGLCAGCGVDVLIPQDGARRCPAKHGALGRICELPTGHPGLHTGSGPNGSAVWDGDAP